jgi:hypothetical protein
MLLVGRGGGFFFGLGAFTGLGLGLETFAFVATRARRFFCDDSDISQINLYLIHPEKYRDRFSRSMAACVRAIMYDSVPW